MKSLAALALVLALGSAQASTVNFDFSYSGTDIFASGLLVTETTATSGVYQVTGITGARNGLAITALSTFDGADNLLYFPATDTGTALNPTQLDNDGISFDVGNVSYNIFTSSSRATVVENDGGPAITFQATPSEIAASVPEPSTVALVAASCFGLLFSRRKSR